ncbi:MAG TPA: alpha-amylase/4-alpha-glucanotransferase domain-containing protein [Gemmatimonadales bacterium]
MTEPIRLVFGVHVHQPVGNFDSVFEDHVRDVYLPFLRAVAERDFLPIALHISGPLLEWLDGHDHAYLDLVGELAADGRVELLLSGFYEPILAALPPADRIEQIVWMREAIQTRFGQHATGLWLTERVWEPGLATDLVDAGVRYLLVDDRHFLVTGFERHQLHTPFHADGGGTPLGVLPIDERLRYLVPFQSPAETVAYLGDLRLRGARLAVLADDGEKFGGWPGTKAWVYERGWLASFLDAMGAAVGGGDVRLCTPRDAITEVASGGLVYLPTASYREMETWSLPPAAAERLERIETELGRERLAGADGALLRGGHWPHFLVKYPESNRMHKKMVRLSRYCRTRADPPDARRAIGRAQCNDAYWHGVFGGLYLPHLREALWRELARAEALLRRGESLQHELLDFDVDGHVEAWIHSDRFSALVRPAWCGALLEYTAFDRGLNFANVLTRRRELYHARGAVASPDAPDPSGVPSIHDLERRLAVDERPTFDVHERVMLMERVLSGDTQTDAYTRSAFEPIMSGMTLPCDLDAREEPGDLTLILRPRVTAGLIEKQMRFSDDGTLTIAYRWNRDAFPADAVFAPELSLAGRLAFHCDPETTVWSYPISTITRSESGLEATEQGTSFTPRWPVALGHATLTLLPHR